MAFKNSTFYLEMLFFKAYWSMLINFQNPASITLNSKWLSVSSKGSRKVGENISDNFRLAKPGKISSVTSLDIWTLSQLLKALLA